MTIMKQDDDIAGRLREFDPIGLRDMDAVQLLNRINTKFVLPMAELDRFLEGLRPHYRVLEVAERKYQTYQTLYLDTPEAGMYLMHHNGIARRVKVRKRWYIGSHLAFFEIKKRDNKKRTIKTRRRLPSSEESRSEFRAWVEANCPYDAQTLLPRTWTKFHRVTLVDHGLSQRVTIDCGLSFKSAIGEADTMLPSADEGWRSPQRELCVVEVKRGGSVSRPVAMELLRSRKVEPQSFSKYCIGTALLSPELKQGCFRPLLRTLGDLRP